MVEITNVFRSLKEVSKAEEIIQKVAFLAGDDSMSLFIIALNKNQTLPAHYHKKGIEIYYILSGSAILTTTLFHPEKQLDIDVKTVIKGDAFSIPPFNIHQIANHLAEIVIILAIAPKNHNHIDRYFVELDLNSQ